MYDTVLIPTDGSPGTETVLDHGLTFAERYGATVHLLHVVDQRQYLGEADDVQAGIAADLQADGDRAVAVAAERTAEAEDMVEVWDPETQTNRYVPKSQATGLQPARDLDGGDSASASGSGRGWSSDENRKYEGYKERFTTQNDLGDPVVDYEAMHRAMRANGDEHLIIEEPPKKKGKGGTSKDKSRQSDDGGWFSGWFGGSEEDSRSGKASKTAASQGGQKTFTRADAEASARKHNMSVQEVIRKLESNGWRLVD
jgi:hypothetical protein